jgi:hypothetical protein
VTAVYVPITADWDKASAADAADAFDVKKRSRQRSCSERRIGLH